MNDNEIIKALTHCINSDCSTCPCNAMNCSEKIPMAFAIDLINRQKAENERLIDLVNELADCNVAWVKDNHDLRVELKTAKAEAIKEFADMLKNSMVIKLDRKFYFPIIDNLVKEMTEETP